MANQEEVIKIFTFYYKPEGIVVSNNIYVPVWAGKNGKKNEPLFTGDDSGDNISDKNKYYSELSGIYWVWKNTDTEIVGTCHYRRYFTNADEPFFYRVRRALFFFAGLMKKRHGLIYTNNINRWKPMILSQDEVINILGHYDAILPVKRKLRQSIKQHYNKYHNPNDLILIRNILSEYYPGYLKSYEDVLNSNRLFANNMFILRRKNFEELMNWLFFILFRFEEKIDKDNYKGYQERIFGFLSERLVTVWVTHNNINYKELPLIYFKTLKEKAYNESLM